MGDQLKLKFGDSGARATTPARPARIAEAPLETVSAFRRAASEIATRLGDAVGEPIRLAITDNKRIMLSARRRAGHLEVRLHHMFIGADDATLVALGRYLCGGDKASGRKIDAFIESHRGTLDGSRRRRTILRTRGEHHDLLEIFHHLVSRHFESPFDVRITWGRRARPKRRRRRSIQLGTYVADERLIRIHPVLDQAWVPRFYVEAVVFHEMLHHDMQCVVKNGRRMFHTKEFRARERSFEMHEIAERWETENLSRLLASH